MRRSVLTVVLSLAFVSIGSAQEAPLSDVADAGAPQVVEAPAASVVSTPPPAAEVKLEARAPEVRETRVADADAATPVSRGSFWWYVAVLVAAGVILALVLD